MAASFERTLARRSVNLGSYWNVAFSGDNRDFPISSALIQLELLSAKIVSRIFSVIFGIFLENKEIRVSPISYLKYQDRIAM